MGFLDIIANKMSKRIADEVRQQVKNEVKTSVKESLREKDEEDKRVKEELLKNPLYIKLKEYRLNKSKEENVRAYCLYSNSTLEELVKIKPKSIDELKSIKGFGEVKSEKYGADIISIIMENL